MPVPFTNYEDVFPSKWIKSDDIPEDGNLVLTVDTIAWEQVGQDQESRMILRFGEIEQGLVVNKTNAVTLGNLFGKNPNGWVGKRIALFATPVSFGGKTVMGVRVNPRAPKQPAQKPANGQPAAATPHEQQIVKELGYDAPPAPPEFEAEFDDSGL